MCDHVLLCKLQVHIKFSQLFGSPALYQQYTKYRCRDIKLHDCVLIVQSTLMFTCFRSGYRKRDFVQITSNKFYWISFPNSKSGHRSHIDGYKWSHMCLNARQVQKCEVTFCSPKLFPINLLLSMATESHRGT